MWHRKKLHNDFDAFMKRKITLKCGVYGGNKQCKSLIQLMACCVTNSPLVYYTFGDSDLCGDLNTMHEYLSRNKVTVGKRIHWNEMCYS